MDIIDNKPQMNPVKSGTIGSIGFSKDKLYVLFLTGNLYVYSNISQDQYIELWESESKGTKLKEIVKNKIYKKL